MRSVPAVFAGLLLCSACAAGDLFYSDAEADCAAKLIYMNECSAKEENLVYWSPKEDFPSLGIGHFIWYPEGSAGPYQESFPAFLEFAFEMGLRVPGWLMEAYGHAPWKSREEFMADLPGARMAELREFLIGSRREQAHFILRRFQRVFPTILDGIDLSEREGVRQKYELLKATPEGTFAMVDYVNFKGEGFQSDARYQGVGWGLAQVLIEMDFPDDPSNALEEFITAAKLVLERRVQHSPRPEVEAGWLPGWNNRVNGYRSISC